MPGLAELQDRFGAFVLGRSEALPPILGPAPAERAAIYRSAARATLVGVLREVFPAVEALVGGAFFAAAATRLLRVQPPRDAVLSGWGDGFADGLAAMPEAVSVPYLPDVARFEWAVHEAAAAPDRPSLDVSVLACIPEDRLAGLRCAAHPSVRLLALSYRADTIARAMLSGDAAAWAAVDPTPGTVRLIVQRGCHGVVATPVAAEDWDFLAALTGGQALGAVLSHAGDDAAARLAAAFTAGRIGAVRPLPL